MSVPSERKFSPSALNFVIPARAGSKGIKNKNLRRIRGKTLVEHAVRAAVDSNYAGEIVVTSNSQDVRRIFLSTDVHFHERSSWASSDQSRAEDVIRELLDSYSFRLTDVIVYLQPTSPLRTGPHVKGALDAFFRESAPIVGVSPVNIHPSKMVTINSDGRIEGLTGDFKPSANRQSLSPIFAPNGSIYVFSVEDFEKHSGFPILNAIPFEMNTVDGMDLDSVADLMLARLLLRGRNA